MSTFYDNIILKEGKVALAINEETDRTIYKMYNQILVKELTVFDNEFMSIIQGKTIDNCDIKLALNKRNCTCVIIYKMFKIFKPIFFGGKDFYCEMLEVSDDESDYYLCHFYTYDNKTNNIIQHSTAELRLEMFDEIKNIDNYEDIINIINNE